MAKRGPGQPPPPPKPRPGAGQAPRRGQLYHLRPGDQVTVEGPDGQEFLVVGLVALIGTMEDGQLLYVPTQHQDPIMVLGSCLLQARGVEREARAQALAEMQAVTATRGLWVPDRGFMPVGPAPENGEEG
jgi:hypothetical protein